MSPRLRFPWRVVPALVCVALSGACGGDGTPSEPLTEPDVTSGSLSVVLERLGEGNDPDGVTVSLWAGSLIATRKAMLGDTISFGELHAGAYTISMDGVDALCRGQVADVVRVDARENVLRLKTECAGRFLFETAFSDTRVGVSYVDPDSRVRALALPGRNRVRGMSPDGEKALIESWEMDSCGVGIHTIVADMAGGAVALEQHAGRPFTASAQWSAAGHFIAARQDGTPSCIGAEDRAIVLYDAASGAIARTLAGGTAQVLGPDVAWSPDGGRLAYVENDRILAYEVQTGRLSQLFAAGSGVRPTELAWAPNGRYILFRPDPESEYRLVDLTDGSVSDVPVAGATAAAWHPAGNLLAVEGTDPVGVSVFDVGAGTVIPATAEPLANAGHPTWNQAGDRLLLDGTRPSGSRALYIVDWPARTSWAVLEGDAAGPIRGRWARGPGAR